jgi:hypothetical protein
VPLGQQLPGQRAQESAAVAMSDHRRLGNEGIDNLDTLGQVREVCLRPCPSGIGLQMREGHAGMFHNPLSHQGLIEIFSNQRDLLRRVAPPAKHRRCSQPALGERQLRNGARPETIG